MPITALTGSNVPAEVCDQVRQARIPAATSSPATPTAYNPPRRMRKAYVTVRELSGIKRSITLVVRYALRDGHSTLSFLIVARSRRFAARLSGLAFGLALAVRPSGLAEVSGVNGAPQARPA